MTFHIMLNPLRVPIVLLVILGVMLAYVHASHRERDVAAMSEIGSADELDLRKFGAPPRTAALLNDSAMGIGQTRPVSQASVTDLLTAEIATLPLYREGKLQPTEAESAGALTLPKPLVAEREQVATLPSLSRPDRQAHDGPMQQEGELVNRETPEPDSARPSQNVLRRVRGPRVEDASYRPQQHLPVERRPIRARSHRICDGDTLRRLAARYLGSEDRYEEIFAANRDILVRPDLLPIGQLLNIPTE